MFYLTQVILDMTWLPKPFLCYYEAVSLYNKGSTNNFICKTCQDLSHNEIILKLVQNFECRVRTA